MSENKFTPGPWVGIYSNNMFLPRVQDKDGNVIAIFKSLKNSNDLELFAAAAELLWALEKIIADIDDCDESIGSSYAVQYAREVIAKAKGDL